jgi:hypothetical protein
MNPFTHRPAAGLRRLPVLGAMLALALLLALDAHRGRRHGVFRARE